MKKKGQQLGMEDLDRIIEMAWEDRTPFEAIRAQFGLTEGDVRGLMRKELSAASYRNWRRRVENCRTKHLQRRDQTISRFRSSRQRAITGNKISKR
ncbi:MAG: TIGR03643 family protein [Flavobacterium sp.]